MNDVRCPRCGGSNPPNAVYCGMCAAQLNIQPPINIPPPTNAPPPASVQPPPPAGYYPPPVPGLKVMGDNTKWALGLGIASFFCCGPITAIIGLFLAKKDMDAIAAGRAPQLDEKWAKWAFYLNIGGLILSVLGLCLFWGMSGLRRF